MSKSTSTLIVLAIALVIGFFLGFSFNGNNQSTEPNEELLRQLEKAKAFFPTISEMYSVFGTVKEIKGNTITIETIESPNPFEDIPLIREIIVTQNTEIIKQENKDPEQYQKEFDEYLIKVDEQIEILPLDPLLPPDPSIPQEPLIPPDPFEEKTIGINDIKINDQISVDAGKNIKTLKSFEAVKIMVQASFGLPAPIDVGLPAPAPPPGSVPEQAITAEAAPPPAPAPPPPPGSVPEQAIPPPAP